jgi:hypothetical protein
MQPFEVDFSTVGGAVNTFFQVVGAILNRQRGVIAAVHNEPGMLGLSLVIVLIAGVSERIGQSVVLFANEIKPHRFVYSLLIGALLFLGGYVLWVVSIYLVAVLLFQTDASLRTVIRAVGLGYAPLFLGFLGLIPYFGSGILTILYFWVFTAIVSAVQATLGLPAYQAVIASAGGGLLILGLRATIGKPFVKLARQFRNIAAGKRLQLKIREAVENRDFDTLFAWVDEEDVQK